MNFDFTNRKVLVGGATDGIGWSSAKLFAANGAELTLLGRNDKKLAERASELSRISSSKIQTLNVDFTKPEELENKLSQFLLSQRLEIDVVINNTGGPPGGRLESASSVELISAFNMHLISYHKILRVISNGMKERSFGRIINVISTSVKQPLNGLGVSNTVRGAVANWAKTLSNELGEYNITVNNVLPGATNTGRLNEIIRSKAQKQAISEQLVKDGMASEVPMKRIAEPEEVAYAILFLASDYASYINGINLPVDGGRTKSL